MKKRLLSVVIILLSIFALFSCELTFNKKTTTFKTTTGTTTTITTTTTTKESTTTTTITSSITTHSVETTTTKSTTTKPITPIENSEDVKSYLLYEGNYYDSVTNEMLNDSAALKAELNRIINNGYIRKSYTSDYSLLTNIDKYDDYYIECIYTGQRLEAITTNGEWDREHIWAKSYGFKDESYDAYSDLHHLRVAEQRTNKKRSDSYFGAVDITETFFSDVYGNKWIGNAGQATMFEPRDEVKGDIARMLLYMVVKYEDPEVLDLELTDDVSLINASNSIFGGLKPDTTGMTTSKANTINSRTYKAEPMYFGLLSALLKWSIEDPVDEREITRNNNIYAVQKNRNPFIDHPEYAYYIYKEEYTSMNISYDANNYNFYMLSDKDAIAVIDEHIMSLPDNVTLENSEQILQIRQEYDSLGTITKSFVDKYYVFKEKEYLVQKMYDRLNPVLTKSVSFDFSDEGARSGTVYSSPIEVKYSSTETAAAGLPAQITAAGQKKDNTLMVEYLYSTIKGLCFTWNANNAAGEATVTVTDKNGQKVEQRLSYTKSNTKVYLDISSLDYSGGITIVVSNETRSGTEAKPAANTLRIVGLEFVLSIPS